MFNCDCLVLWKRREVSAFSIKIDLAYYKCENGFEGNFQINGVAAHLRKFLN